MGEALETRIHDLEARFRHIGQARMVGVPLLNPALRVQAVGFRRHDAGWLGVLITPWFINLILLPRNGDWAQLPLGSTQDHAFPSGAYRFVVAEEAGIGRYQSCSLLSPVPEFAEQDSAAAFAVAALEALQNPEPDTPRDQPAMSRRAFLRGCLPARAEPPR